MSDPLTETSAQGYCRLHGVHRSVCGCRVASVDPDAVKVAHNAIQRAYDTTRSTT